MNLNFSSAKMTTENYFDWSQISLIQGATFTSEVDMPEVRSLALQVVGDFTRKENSGRIEGALQSAHRAAEILLS